MMFGRGEGCKQKTRLSNSSDEEISTGLNSSRISETGIQSKPGKVRDYNDSYLAMGFSWTGDIRCPLPECIVCGESSQTLPWHQQN